MANHLINDLHQTVIAVGAPGSIERAKCEHPALIGKLCVLRDQGKLTRPRANQLLGFAKVRMIAERRVILQAVGLTAEQARQLGGWQ